MTVNSFTSLSLDPPLVLVSLERITRTHRLVMQAGHFGITILGEHQQEISDRFAGRLTEHLDRFEDLPVYELVSGAPLLGDGLASLDCKVISAFEAGTHTVFVGEVQAVRRIEDDAPLVYYNRDYRELGSL
jgi:flavin reductase (DIM6/NTAB) family NADH-FMN oxidoreductase RutF